MSNTKKTPKTFGKEINYLRLEYKNGVPYNADFDGDDSNEHLKSTTPFNSPIIKPKCSNVKIEELDNLEELKVPAAKK